MQTKHLHVSIRIRKKGEVGTVKHVFLYLFPVFIFTDRSNAVPLLWIVVVIFVCL